MVLLVLVPISVVMIDARREAQDDETFAASIRAYRLDCTAREMKATAALHGGRVEATTLNARA